MKTKRFLLTAGIVLATAFTFSCSSDDSKDDDGGGGSFTDSRDSKTYKSVKIGNQTWMAKNLNYNAPGSKCANKSLDMLTENDADCEEYGRLYDWATAMNGATSSTATPSGVRGVCPTGWHLPSKAEWEVMTAYIGGESTEGKKLKATSYGGTDDYGFSALPGGWGSDGGNLHDADTGAWWTASEDNSDRAYSRYMRYSMESAVWYNSSSRLHSVRCVKDN